MVPIKTNLLNFNAKALASFCEQLEEKPFRATQLLKWIHKQGVSHFDDMSNLSQSFRKKLTSLSYIEAPHIKHDHLSYDGTRKWLFDVNGGNAIETVYIPEFSRGTLCISSQAGCAVNCQFCSTGKQGFNRNLTTAEIIGQLWAAEFILRRSKVNCSERMITNVVMMGMGEPLLNYKNVIEAMSIMLDDNAYGLSKRKVTLSTSGVVPMMDRLAKELPVSLAVSLHASNDLLRDQLVPLNQKYPLKELIAGCQRYLEYSPRGFITFEYCMLHDVNDSVDQARELIKLTKSLPCKFNLIPFNRFPNTHFECASQARIKQFATVLQDHDIVTTIRKTRGDDIDAACGQLAGEVKNRIKIRDEKQNISSISILPV